MFRVCKSYLYLLPAGVILLVFHLVPFAAIVAISFYRNWGMAESVPVGMANYRQVLSGGELLSALVVTLWYAVGTIPVTLLLALVLAVILHRKVFGATVYRVIYFLPFITSTVAAAAVWKWIFHVDQKGLANSLLAFWGAAPLRFTEESRGIFELIFGSALPVLGGGPSLALVSVMVFAVWQTFGFYVVIFSAGLGQIPREVYEAAELDGAGRVRTFFSITLPLLRPIVGFLLIVSTIGAFQTFNQIYIMAPSERFTSARNLTMYIVTQFWDFGHLDRASAAAVLLFLILAALTAGQLALSRRRD